MPKNTPHGHSQSHWLGTSGAAQGYGKYLRQKTQERSNMQRFIDDMIETMKEWDGW